MHVRRIVLITLISGYFSSFAYGWKIPILYEIERETRQLRDTLGQIVTLGELKRQRDKARAEEQRKAAEQARLAAEALKREKINGLTEKQVLLDEIVGDFSELSDSTSRIQDSIGNAITIASSELTNRTYFDSAYIRLRNMVSQQEGFVKDSITTIDLLMHALLPVEYKTVITEEEDVEIDAKVELGKEDIENVNPGIKIALDALDRLNEIAINNGVEKNELFEELIVSMNTVSAEDLVRKLTEIQSGLIALSEYLEIRMQYYQESLDSVNVQLSELHA